ncbi:EamA family transporter [Candidatus Uhrbacteria bacterium]|nr:EamA family transporter [Candidatus Uhrbacteria bacterium]
MLWLLYAFLASLSFVVSNLADKVILSRTAIRSPLSINTAGSLINGLVALLILSVKRFTLPPQELLAALAVGALGFLAVAWYLGAIHREEASRVVPLWAGTDIFVPLFALIFLHEPLTKSIVIAIALVVIGSVALQSDLKNGLITRKPVALLLMLLASLTWASGVVIAEAVLENVSVFVFWVWSAIGYMAAGIIPLILWFPRLLCDLRAKWVLPGILVSTGSESLGLIFKFLALALAPAAIVQIAGASQYVLVFLISILLTLFVPRLIKERIDRPTLITKILALVLIITGIALVTLNGK